jgi:translation elongation factor EF-Ts
MNQQEQLTHIKILAQIQLNYLTDFKAKNKSFFTGTFKQFCNNLIKHLINIETQHFDPSIKSQEKAVTVCYDIMDSFYKDVTRLGYAEFINYYKRLL